MSVPSPCPSSSSASGLPASPFVRGPTVLVLSGVAAQHVAVMTKRHDHGRIQVMVDYGHLPHLRGRSLSLNGGEYVRTDSPTCPALPRRVQ